MEERYYSNGKLIISGEYLVLYGSESLVLPLSFGQSMSVKEIDGSRQRSIEWRSKQYGELWFSAVIEAESLTVLKTTDISICKKLLPLLLTIKNIKPEKFKTSLSFETNINFDRNWGLGTSSTLLNNLASWAETDPFILHFQVSEGSGFDIAAAKFSRAFVYSIENQIPKIRFIDFNPVFSEQLYFVFLGRKQDTAGELIKNRYIDTPDSDLIRKINGITDAMIKCETLTEFQYLMNQHEQLISAHIQKKPIGNLFFPDFCGTVKSLGAWGGDFALFTTNLGKDYVHKYLAGKGLHTYFSFSDIIHVKSTVSQS